MEEHFCETILENENINNCFNCGYTFNSEEIIDINYDIEQKGKTNCPNCYIILEIEDLINKKDE